MLPKIRKYEIDDREYWNNFMTEIERKLLRNQTTVIIEPEVIGKGKTSSVFKLYDTKRKVNMVCKIDHSTIERSDAKLAYQIAYNRWTSQCYSVFMANLYRHLTCELNAAPIFFLPPSVPTTLTPKAAAATTAATTTPSTTSW